MGLPAEQALTATVDVRRLDSESKLAHKTALPLAGDLTRDASHAARGLTGGQKLLVALVKAGLAPAALWSAAALCVELDRPRDLDGEVTQTDAQRLDNRARVYTGRSGFGSAPARDSIGRR